MTALRVSVVSLALQLVLIGCSTVQVTSDFDPETDFAGLRTWNWADLPVQIYGNRPELRSDLLQARIRRAVEEGLRAKGYQRVDSEPDFLVHYAIGIEEKIQVDTIYPSVGVGYGRYGRWSTASFPETQVRQYDEGTLLLDVLSPEGRLLWRGTAQGRIAGNLEPSEREERARSTANALLEKFPPEKG